MADLKETVTITRELKGPRKDLAEFVLWLEEKGLIKRTGAFGTKPGNADLIELTSVWWDMQHGED